MGTHLCLGIGFAVGGMSPNYGAGLNSGWPLVVSDWWPGARGISPSIVKISRFDKNRRHRALIQRASEPEDKR